MSHQIKIAEFDISFFTGDFAWIVLTAEKAGHGYDYTLTYFRGDDAKPFGIEEYLTLYDQSIAYAVIDFVVAKIKEILGSKEATQMFTEEELSFASVKGVGSIAMVKRVRTSEPYDDWYVVDQVETCDGYRKRTTRTHTYFIAANEDYQKRLELMKEKGISK